MKSLRPLAAICAIFLLSGCKDPQKEKSQRDASEALDAASVSIKEQLREDLDNGGLSVDEEFDPSEMMDALDKLEGASDGQDKIAAGLAKYFITRFAEISAKLTNVSGDLNAGLDFSGVETAEDLDELSRRVMIYKRMNQEVKAEISEGVITDLKAEADKRGLEGKVRRNFFASVEGRFKRQLPVLHTIRDCDDELCEAILSQHKLLKKHLGEWEWSAEAEILEFASDEALEDFNALATKVQEVAAEQLAAQRILVEMQ
jgi:hypothetical protein